MRYNTKPYADRYALPRTRNFDRPLGFSYKIGGKFAGVRGR